MVAVDKPAGMYAHPAPGHETGTVSDAVLAMRPEIAGAGGPGRPGIVHRLDSGTSGVMLLAKTRKAYLALREMFSSHGGVAKTYLAVLNGAPETETGVVDEPIGRKPWDPHRMAVDGTDAKPAVTRWRTLSRHGGISLVEFRIDTGRTHQIRVHAAWMGCPVAGDTLYGRRDLDMQRVPRPSRPLLHAVRMEFRHPFTGEKVSILSPPPPDMVYIR